jgi:hypothetical protein
VLHLLHDGRFFQEIFQGHCVFLQEARKHQTTDLLYQTILIIVKNFQRSTPSTFPSSCYASPLQSSSSHSVHRNVCSDNKPVRLVDGDHSGLERYRAVCREPYYPWVSFLRPQYNDAFSERNN